VQFTALAAGFQVAVEQSLDHAQALVERLPRQITVACGGRLVTRGVQVVAQRREQVGVVSRVVIDEPAELPLDVFLHAYVPTQRVQELAQSDVGELVEGLAGGIRQHRLRPSGRLVEGTGGTGEVRDLHGHRVLIRPHKRS
jgi:hypothetical protein